MEGVLLKCFDEEHPIIILDEMHNGVCGGHYMKKTTTHKVISARFGGPIYLEMLMCW